MQEMRDQPPPPPPPPKKPKAKKSKEADKAYLRRLKSLTDFYAKHNAAPRNETFTAEGWFGEVVWSPKEYLLQSGWAGCARQNRPTSTCCKAVLGAEMASVRASS